jgi:hypothetical protein
MFERTLPDGRILTLLPLYGGRGRVMIARAGDRRTHDDAW